MNENDQNPYQTPSSDIETQENNDALLAIPNTVPVGRGFSWIERSISKTIKPQLGIWMLIGLIYGVISIVISLIPLVNIIVPYLLAPVFSAGLILGAHKVFKGEKLELGQLFAGFHLKQSSQLFIIGLFTILSIIVVVVVMFMFVGFDFFAAAMSGNEPDPQAIMAMAGKFLILIPLGFVAFIIFMLLFWFPPALIGFHEMSAMDAIKLGFKGGMKNIGAVIVFALMLIVLGFVLGLIFAILIGVLSIVSQWFAIAVAVLLVVPLALLGSAFWAGTTYHAYRDIFIAQD